MKHYFENFEDNIDVFSIKRICISNDYYNDSKKRLINKNIKNFLNTKTNCYCFRYVCIEKYYSEITDERSTLGLMDMDIMKIRMRNMVLKHCEV